MTIIKKTVAIHPIMDKYIRRTWSLLVESGYDATYSTALNFMLLAAIMEAQKEGGLTERTREIIWSFMDDKETIEKLNLEDQLANYHNYIKIIKEKQVKIIKEKQTNTTLNSNKK